MTEERRIQITDVRVLRALANPIRYRILGHLMSSGAQTASECAAVVGASPSNCSATTCASSSATGSWNGPRATIPPRMGAIGRGGRR